MKEERGRGLGSTEKHEIRLLDTRTAPDFRERDNNLSKMKKMILRSFSKNVQLGKDLLVLLCWNSS